MLRGKAAISVVLGLFFFTPPVAAEAQITIRVWLLVGLPMGDERPSAKTEILSARTSPQLTAFQSLAGRSQSEFKNALIDALLEIGDLKRLDELFLLQRPWEKDRPEISSAAIKNQLAFRIDLTQIKFAPPSFRASGSYFEEPTRSDSRG